MSVGFSGFDFPPPTDWQAFERLCRDLWASIWNDPNTQMNGRGGQKQAGVDIYGQPSSGGGLSAVQCKRKGNVLENAEISERELRVEVAKAKTFTPALTGEFIVAFTGKRDAKILAVARAITAEHQAAGLFNVVVYSWEDIQERLGDHHDVVAKHYSSLQASFRALDERVLPEPASPTADAMTAPAHSSQARSVIFADDYPLIETEHRAEIQMVRVALKEGHARVALSQAESLRARIWTSASPESRARILVLIAHARLELREDAEAARLLLEAAGHAPENAYVQAQVALGHSLLENDSAALAWASKALAQNPTDILAVQVAALYDPRSDQEVLDSYEPIVGKRAELYSILGHRARRRAEVGTARAWFERAVEVEPKPGEISVTAAQAIIDSVDTGPASMSLEAAKTRADLDRAVGLLNDAISSLKDDAARKARSEWYLSRVFAKRLLGASDAAAVADEALAICGRLDVLVRNRAAIASDCSDHRMVVELVQSLPQPREPDDIGLLAAAFGNLGEHRKSTELWEELLGRAALPDHVQHEAHRNHVLSLLLEGRNTEATTAAETAMLAASGALSPILVAVALWERLGDTAERDKRLDAAVVAAAGAQTYLCLQLGDALVRAERWNDAAEVYSSAVRNGADDVYGRRRLQALYKAGRYDSALRLCDEVDSANGRSRFAAEMRSSIYEVLGDLGRAAQACKDFLAIEPRNPVLGLRLALVLQRTGDVAASAIALANLDPEAVTDIESASILTQMLVRIGKPNDALEVAYRMRRRHLQNVDAHVRYVSLYTLAKGLEDTEQADLVTPDSAVLLEGNGAPGWVLVSPSNEADLNQREYSRSHPLTRGLLGKCIGDSVSIGGPTSSWTVAAIGTKYGFAFGRTLELFPSHFPTNAEIEQHPIPKGDGEFINQLKERLQRGDPRRQAALNEYAAGRCTVGSVATILRISTLQAIGTILNAPGGLVCSTNSVDERSTSLLALAAPNVPLLLDLSAIIALDGIGMLRDGTLARYPLFVAQRTLDEIASEEFRWQTTSSDGAMSIGIEGDVLTRYVTTPEDVGLLRKHFGDLLAWLRVHVVVAPVPPEVAERHADQDRFGDFIGESAWDTIRIATGPDLLLVSDDLWLRLLGKSTMAVNGVCTAMLLMAEMQTGRLERDRYCEAMVKLIASGYRHLSVDGSILEAAARVDQWRRGAVLGKVLDRLRGPETHAESAIVVGVEFIRRIWLNVVLSQQRVTLLIAVLDVLIAGRNRAEVLTRVRLHVGQALVLLPLAQEEVFRIILGWNAMGVVAVAH